MSDATQTFEIHRIMVAIDSSTHAASALEAAAILAAQLHAELEGIFVQDINLARLAELQVGREIQFLTGKSRDYTAEALATQNREEEVSARRALAAAAARARVTCVFRVAQGQVDLEVIGAASNADLLILGMGKPSPGGRSRLGTTARAVAEHAPRSVLISKSGVRTIGAPLVCYDGSNGAKRALEAAVRLVGGRDRSLTIVIVSPEIRSAAALRQEVDDRLNLARIAPKFLHAAEPGPDQLCRFAAESGSDVLVVSADASFLSGDKAMKVLEEIACPVLLVR